MNAVALASLLAMGSSPVRAQESAVPADTFDAVVSARDSSECRPLPGVGCVYVPANLDREPGLMIYFRGHWRSYRGQVPEELRVESARSALAAYGIKAAADRSGLTVLITGSSSVGIGDRELAEARAAAGRPFSRLVLAAHSGGYIGLGKSLPHLPPAARILMLDDFYFDADLTALIKARVEAGTSCTGFVTRHSRARWEARFKPFLVCPVDLYQDSEHEAAVPRCLGAYLERTTCL